MNEENDKSVFLTVIAGRKQKDELLTALLNSGIHLINTVYGKGGAMRVNGIKYVLGLIPEENKVLITCVSDADKASAAMNMLTEKFHFDKPNTGIAFTVNIENIAY